MALFFPKSRKSCVFPPAACSVVVGTANVFVNFYTLFYADFAADLSKCFFCGMRLPEQATEHTEWPCSLKQVSPHFNGTAGKKNDNFAESHYRNSMCCLILYFHASQKIINFFMTSNASTLSTLYYHHQRNFGKRSTRWTQTFSLAIRRRAISRINQDRNATIHKSISTIILFRQATAKRSRWCSEAPFLKGFTTVTVSFRVSFRVSFTVSHLIIR